MKMLRVVSGPITAHIPVGRHTIPLTTVVVALAVTPTNFGVSMLNRGCSPLLPVHPKLRPEYLARATDAMEGAWLTVLMEEGWIIQSDLVRVESDPAQEWWPWSFGYGSPASMLNLLKRAPFMHSTAALKAEGLPDGTARFLAALTW